MLPNRSISLILDLIDEYLRGRLKGWQLVYEIDTLVAGNYAHEFSKPVNSLIDAFQDQLALYVCDEEIHKEASEVYFCDDELQIKAKAFKDELQNLLAKKNLDQ